MFPRKLRVRRESQMAPPRASEVIGPKTSGIVFFCGVQNGLSHSFFIPCCVVPRPINRSTSSFTVQPQIKYMAKQRHIYYMTFNYAGLGSARGISPIRRDPMGARYHRAFLSAMGQAKFYPGYLHSPRCLTAP